METKKVLAPFDLNKPDKIYNGFLYPNIGSEEINSFLDIATGKEWKVGMVVYVGKEISKNDVFAQIVDSGKKIRSVNDLLTALESYLKQISTFKIGDIIGITSSDIGFELVKLKKPLTIKSKLP